MPQQSTQKEAMLYESLEGQAVQCRLCGHECRIQPGKRGICHVRQNVGGKLVTGSYDALVAMHIDPIEKKPLFHVLPGSLSLSIAAAGCNFQCAFCQNWQISQPRADGLARGQPVPPEDIVASAVRNKCHSISYTYTEPTIFFELAYETSRLAHRHGVKNAFVSNGYMTPAAVELIAPYLDAINVDLKAFRDETYRRVMHARLEPVLTCLRALVKNKIWVEVTTLVVPGMNDSDAELSDIARFIANDLGPDVPWHVSRFHPDYRFTQAAATPIDTLRRAVQLGVRAGLRYVYAGNVPGEESENTFCPSCRARLIRRVGFSVAENRLAAGQCPDCKTPVPGIW